MKIFDTLHAERIATQLNFVKHKQSISYRDKQALLSVTVPIYNARYQQHAQTFAQGGFELIYDERLEKAILNANSPTHNIEQRVMEVLQQMAFKDVLAIGYVKRSSECIETPLTNDPECIRPVANFVHADWGPSRVARLGNTQDSIINHPSVSPELIKNYIDHHLQWKIVNVWIALELVVNNTLAMCSAKSIDMSSCYEVIFKSMRDNKKTNNINSHCAHASIMSLAPNPTQRWYYFPMIQPGEMLIFYQASSGMHLGPPVMHSNIQFSWFSKFSRRSIEFRFLLV